MLGNVYETILTVCIPCLISAMMVTYDCLLGRFRGLCKKKNPQRLNQPLRVIKDIKNSIPCP
jgi:hypothetical protein